MKALSPPIRFIVAILALWVGFRIATFIPLYPDRPEQPPDLIAAPPSQSGRLIRPPALAHRAPGGRRSSPWSTTARASIGEIRPWTAAPAGRRYRDTAAGRPMAASRRAQLYLAAFSPRIAHTMLARWATGPQAARPLDPLAMPRRSAKGASRWSLAGWSLLRAGSGPAALASGGQLGASQAGLRLQYRLAGTPDAPIAASVRLSRPLSGADGGEAALGVSILPARRLPVTVHAERRIALERGGRDAWALGAAGGVSGVALAHDFALDGWAQAGVVGARSRDLYADAAVSVARPVYRAGPVSLSLGSGAWAAAQRGASRVDIGPRALLRLPAAEGALQLGLSWRERIAGGAAPGSGPALTLAAEF